MTFAERTRSALCGEVVLICASLPLMKVLWTDNVCLVRRQELLMETMMSTGQLWWWSEYIFDKLKRENIAVSGGSGVMSRWSRSALFDPRLMRVCAQKDGSLELEFITFFPLFSPRKKCNIRLLHVNQSPHHTILSLSGCLMHPDKFSNT